ncbi:MAG: hypothetical protein IJV45_01600 [Prevotella sp.]|nr:hypothetical protein [Prevotella sp.]
MYVFDYGAPIGYRSNVALYPEFQKYLRDNQPNAEIHFVPSGHFALESHHTEIARLMREFLRRVIK